MATPNEQVRLLTGLTEAELTSGDIDTLLEMNADSVKLAAADALEVFAGTLTAITSDDISLDGSKRAKVLMDRAVTLRYQGVDVAAEEEFAFDVVGGQSARPELTERGCW